MQIAPLQFEPFNTLYDGDAQARIAAGNVVNQIKAPEHESRLAKSALELMLAASVSLRVNAASPTSATRQSMNRQGLRSP